MFIKNKNTSISPAGGGGLLSRLLSGGILGLTLLFVLMASEAQAAVPLAGTVISNQATATYFDGTTTQTATSNTVQTTVLPVGAYTLLSDNAKQGAPGTTVYMPHVLTNTGNAPDSFNLALPTWASTNAGANVSSYAIFADANGDGVPDSTTALCTLSASSACSGVTTGILAANGGQYSFIVATTLTSGAAPGGVPQIDVIATPATAGNYTAVALTTVPTINGGAYGNYFQTGAPLDALAQKFNRDIVTISAGPVINVTKGIVGAYLPSAPAVLVPGLTTGPRGTRVVYRLNYTNTGNAAGALYLKDVIGTALSSTSGYNYVANSSKWSSNGTAAIALTDNGTGASNTAQIKYTVTPVPLALPTTTLEAKIANIAPNVGSNVSGYIEFQVDVTATAALGISTTNNIGSYADLPVNCTNAGAGTVDCTIPGTLTPTNYSPFTVTGVYSVVANKDLTTVDGDNVTPTGQDLVVPSANPAADPALPPNAPNSAAPGSTVNFNNYIHNTSTSADTFNITVGSFTTGLTAFPTGTVFQLYSYIGGVLAPLVDTNGDNIPDTGSVAAGDVIEIVLKATLPANAPTGAGPYTVSKTATSIADPTKSNVVFDQLATITSANLTLITNNTGQIYPGGTIVYPHGLVNGGSALCAADSTGTPNGMTITVSNSLATAGWQYTLYIDANRNGIVDTSEFALGGGTANSSIVVTNTQMQQYAALFVDSGVSNPLSIAPSLVGALLPNNTLPILVKVTAPSGATTPPANLISVAVSATCGSATVITTTQVTDTTTITLSELRVLKYQALSDVTVNAGPPVSYTCNAPTGPYVTTPLQQKPGQCIWYRVIATNQGQTPATLVSLNDSTPSFTTYNLGAVGALIGGSTGAICTTFVGPPSLNLAPAAAAVTPGVTTPGAGLTGAVTCPTPIFGSVNPGQSVQLDFPVLIDQ